MMDPEIDSCYHLSCPANRVPEEVKEGFFRNYPDFAKAYGRTEQA